MVQFFGYIANSNAITTGNNAQVQIKFDNDTDFELQELRTLGTAMTIQIQTQSGTLFQSSAFTSSAISNTGKLGLSFFKEKIIIPKNSSLVITFTNNSGGTLTDELQLWGYKIS